MQAVENLATLTWMGGRTIPLIFHIIPLVQPAKDLSYAIKRNVKISNLRNFNHPRAQKKHLLMDRQISLLSGRSSGGSRLGRKSS